MYKFPSRKDHTIIWLENFINRMKYIDLTEKIESNIKIMISQVDLKNFFIRPRFRPQNLNFTLKTAYVFPLENQNGV